MPCVNVSELFVIIQPAFASIVRNFGVYFFASQLIQTNTHRVLLNGAKGCQQFEIYGPILSLLTVQQRAFLTSVLFDRFSLLANLSIWNWDWDVDSERIFLILTSLSNPVHPPMQQ